MSTKAQLKCSASSMYNVCKIGDIIKVPSALRESLTIFYRTQVSLGSDLWVLISLTQSIQDYVADLTDVTLAYEDSNSIPTDDVNEQYQAT